MPRVKNGIERRKKHKKIIKKTKGFIGRRKNVYKISKQAYLKSLIYSYRDRKKNKSNFRKKWIKHIGFHLTNMNTNYNSFFNILKKKNIKINRKMIYNLFKKKYISCIEQMMGR
ncbi:50S ribosomal protein L20 [Candidatus Vidania fulgoroideorum]